METNKSKKKVMARRGSLGPMLRNFWRRGSGGGADGGGGGISGYFSTTGSGNSSSYYNNYRPPAKDKHMVASDTLMSELDFHMQELDKNRQKDEQEARRQKTGVDYSWLMESSGKPNYEMPQMERLELEELCYKVAGTECTQVIVLFRQALAARLQASNMAATEPPKASSSSSSSPPETASGRLKPEDLPYIMRSCVRQVLDRRPPVEQATSLTGWVTRGTNSFASLSTSLAGLRLRPPGKIAPTVGNLGDEGQQVDDGDIEMQLGGTRGHVVSTMDRSKRAMSMPNFMVTSECSTSPH